MVTSWCNKLGTRREKEKGKAQNFVETNSRKGTERGREELMGRNQNDVSRPRKAEDLRCKVHTSCGTRHEEDRPYSNHNYV